MGRVANMVDHDITEVTHTQVKLQLTTRHADISLPENTGPILVNTSEHEPELEIRTLTKWTKRSAPICPLNSCQCSLRDG